MIASGLNLLAVDPFFAGAIWGSDFIGRDDLEFSFRTPR
jgi:hypothetical protein